MTGIVPHASHSTVQAAQAATRASASTAPGRDFSAMLDPGFHDGLTGSDNATEFGAYGMFAKARHSSVGAGTSGQKFHSSEEASDDRHPGSGDRAASASWTVPAGTDVVVFTAHGKWLTHDVADSNTDQPVSTSQVATPSLAVAPVEGEASREPELSVAVDANEPGASPGDVPDRSGGEPSATALTVAIDDDGAMIVARADAPATEVLMRVSRMLNDRGLHLGRLTLNGREVAIEKFRATGVYDGRSSR